MKRPFPISHLIPFWPTKSWTSLLTSQAATRPRRIVIMLPAMGDTIKGNKSAGELYYTNSTYLNVSEPINPIDKVKKAFSAGLVS